MDFSGNSLVSAQGSLRRSQGGGGRQQIDNLEMLGSIHGGISRIVLPTISEKNVIAYDIISRHVLIKNKRGTAMYRYEWQPLITLLKEYNLAADAENTTHQMKDTIYEYIRSLKTKIEHLQKSPLPTILEITDYDEKERLWNLNRDLPLEHGFHYDMSHPFIGYIPAKLNKFMHGIDTDMIIYCIENNKYDGGKLFGITDYHSLNQSLANKICAVQNAHYQIIHTKLQTFVAEAINWLKFLDHHLVVTNYIGLPLYQFCYNKIVNGNFYEDRTRSFPNKPINDPYEQKTAVTPEILEEFMQQLFNELSRQYAINQFEDPELMELTRANKPEEYELIRQVRNQALKGPIENEG